MAIIIRLLKTSLLTSLAAVFGWIAYSRTAINRALPFMAPLDAPEQTLMAGLAGRLSYYADTSGHGRPVLLVHSINAAASAYEMRPIFEQLRGKRPVYAFDLPGFGRSDRQDRMYTIEVFVASITAMVEHIHAPDGVDIVALSLGGEFAAIAALRQVKQIHSLVLISPTGFNERLEGEEERRLEGSPNLYRAFSFQLWSQALFDLLTTRASIGYYLDKVFVGPVDQGLLDYCYVTAHQPGARYAPLYFVCGALFTPSVRERIYKRVQQPVLAIYDASDGFVSYEELEPFMQRFANWKAARVVPSSGLPQFEQLDTLMKSIESFWDS